MKTSKSLIGLGAGIAVLGLVLAIVPLFTDCSSQGRFMQLANGMTTPMKCHWTGVAEMALAIPLLGLGGATFLSRRKEARMALGLLGVLLGTFAILLPTTLIGVCASNDMLCNMIMRPTLVLSGALVIGLSIVTALLPERYTGVEAFA